MTLLYSCVVQQLGLGVMCLAGVRVIAGVMGGAGLGSPSGQVDVDIANLRPCVRLIKPCVPFWLQMIARLAA
jgi:hypothetical protein